MKTLLLAFAAAAYAAVQDPQTTIELGRAALERGDVAGAQALFERAVQHSGGSLEARTWLLRSWIEQARVNDALDEIDALAKAHAGKSEIDYLYGMAFARAADEKLRLGGTGGALTINLGDATDHLSRAVAADPTRYKDAFPALARAAWHLRKLDVALEAGQRAARDYSSRADVHFQLGRIALSRFALEQDDPARAEEAERSWALAESSLRKGLELASPNEATRSLAAECARELGHAQIWKGRTVQAVEAYARAMQLDPLQVEFNQVLGSVGVEPFLDGVESAWKAFEPVAAARSAKERATLSWWLGLARFRNGLSLPAAQAFQAAFEADGSFLNSLYYVARARYGAGDKDGAVAALATYAERDPVDLVASLKFDVPGNVPMLNDLAGHCYAPFETLVRASKPAEASEAVRKAALLQELANEIWPTAAQSWSNLGLFLREQGDAGAEAGSLPREEALKLYERSLTAYEKALALAPDNPDYLNDAAVVLHYNLERDRERARQLYERALGQAKKRLAEPDLPPADRAHMSELESWIETNLQRLKKAAEKKDAGTGRSSQVLRTP